MDKEQYLISIDDFEKFKGDNFRETPKLLISELQEQIRNQSGRLLRLTELRAPAVIISGEQQILESLMLDLRNGNYAVTETEINYAVAYQDMINRFLIVDDYDENE